MTPVTPLPLAGEFLFRATLSVGAPQAVGATRTGELRIVPVTGGTIEGPALTGEVLPGTAADWLRVDPDGTAHMDVRLTIKTTEGHVVFMHYSGIRTAKAAGPGPAECRRGGRSRASTTSAPPSASRPAPRRSAG